MRLEPKAPLVDVSVHPDGIVIVAPVVLKPSTTNMRSFCCVPAGVFITRLVPLFMLVVVDARSLIGVVFLSVTVTVQLGVVDGFSVSWCVAPMSLPHVAVTVPVGPAGRDVVA